jgi:hypothetical protein
MRDSILLCPTLALALVACAEPLEDTDDDLMAPYQGLGPFELVEAGMLTLTPAHRQGPNAIDPSLLSDLPLTVRVPEGLDGPLPVVLYSHGGGSRDNPGESGADWSGQLVAGGYAVIAMHHMARTRNDVLANICRPRGVPESDCDTEVYESVYESTDRPQDASAVIDELSTIEAMLGLELDEERMAVLGYSGGTNTPLYMAGGRRNAAPPDSQVTVDAAYPDERPLAFVASSPPGGSGAGWYAEDLAGIERPLLSLTGAGDIEPLLRATLYDEVGEGDKYRLFVNSESLDHGAYNMTGAQVATGSDAALFEVMSLTTRAFLDAQLRNDDSARAWLEAEAPRDLIEAVVPPGDVPSWSAK